jgi:hypothetical protein
MLAVENGNTRLMGLNFNDRGSITTCCFGVSHVGTTLLPCE